MFLMYQQGRYININSIESVHHNGTGYPVVFCTKSEPDRTVMVSGKYEESFMVEISKLTNNKEL